MKTRLITIWDHMSGSYWFVPSTFILFGLGSSALFPYLDWRLSRETDLLPAWFYIGAGTTETILATIAGVMATVVSLVFSLTILTLSIAASQFGPRLLRSFLNNRSTQVVLGNFVATAIYALILLALMRDTDANPFVPCISVYVAVVVSVFNLIYLIHFINDISELIQAPNVVDRVARDLDASVARLYPKLEDDGASIEKDICEVLPEFNAELRVTHEGYMQGVDVSALVEYAEEVDGVLRLLVRPGQFVFRGDVVAKLHGGGDVEESLSKVLNQCMVTGPRRTPRQDVECALLELVELAVRALSPGVNDPFTAINCIDRLGAALGRIAVRPSLPSQFKDEEGVVRLVVPAVVLGDLIDAGFNQVRQHGQGDTAVLIRLLEALGEVARKRVRPSDGKAVLRHVDMVVRAAEAHVGEPNDLDDIKTRAKRIRAKLEEKTEES